mgnify:CR=1 FL=1
MKFKANKTFLIIIVTIMIFLNMISAFGFLSKAHIDQSININTGVTDQIKSLEISINIEKENIADLDKQIAQIDNAIIKINDKNSGVSSLKAATEQRKTRNDLILKKQEYNKKISEYNKEKIKLESSNKKLEAEVGPLKYIASMVYDNVNNDELEKSVRWLIILLVCVFDPLAVLLLIAANNGIVYNTKLNSIRPLSKNNKIEIDKKDLMKI